MANLNEKDMIYEGKAKKLYRTEHPSEYIIAYKDTATAFNGEKKEDIEGKGVLNCAITNAVFEMLENSGIPTHMIHPIDETTILVKKVEIVPLEVIVRNVAAGSFSARFGVPEGTALKNPTTEFSYKKDELGDPMINTSQLLALGLAAPEEVETIRAMALKINELLIGFFAKVNLKLIDFKLEFGRLENGQIVLADEISPDTCRLWDMDTGEKLDKDRFRRDMGQVIEAYQEVFRRISG
ncbi:MAG: phosphoribosylaminoimidazolesuccinocarboxamide synthase [Christensenellales bacterium]|jgi:phosphoribosylaminoimidazole-succinocarboxamide synthase